MSKKKILIYLFIFILLGVTIPFFVVRIFATPSNDRDWSMDQVKIPYADFNENLVTIHNIRNIIYKNNTDYDLQYYDKIFDLNKIKSVDYLISPFTNKKALAHTFLAFGFEDGSYVDISVEIRKEKGESYSPWKGLFGQYEIMYVIGDENDLIKLRTNIWKNKLYLYPIKADKEKIKAVFVDMLERANKLNSEPEFYNTITNTCTTNIIMHVNKFRDKPIKLSYKILLPGYSDEIAYENGMIDNTIPLEELRKKHLINERAIKYTDSPNFSKEIRVTE